MSATEGERSEEEGARATTTFDVEIENDEENLDSPGGEFLRGSDPPLLRRTVRQHCGGVVGVEREGGLTDSATIPREG